MCYDLSFQAAQEQIAQHFHSLQIDTQLDNDVTTMIHVQAQSHRRYPVILQEDGQTKLKVFEWGIIPEYMNTPEKIRKGRASMCNARSEKIIEDKRSYWHRIRRQRCLIPATGFFEHREIKGWKHKVPYFIRLKHRPIFFIAGLYHYPTTRPNPETGEITGTFTLITRSANPLMQQIHNGGDNAGRMPLFLSQDLEARWLSEDLDDQVIAEIMGYQLPEAELLYEPVFTIRTTKERPDQKTKVDAYAWENLPPLGQDGVRDK